MGRIKLHRMKFYACHGALDFEREVPQEFWVDVTIDIDLHRAGQTDALSDTVNYAAVADAVRSLMTGPPIALLETVAYRLHQAVRELDDRIRGAEIRVRKVHPPISVPSDGVEVVVGDGL